MAQSFVHGAGDGAGEQMEHKPGSGLDERYASGLTHIHTHDSLLPLNISSVFVKPALMIFYHAHVIVSVCTSGTR